MVDTGPLHPDPYNEWPERYLDPLPRRTPMEALVGWGQPPPPDPVPPLDSEAAYASPGRPPWEAPEPKSVPAWTWVAIVMAVLLMSCMGLAVTSVLSSSDPGGPVPPAVDDPDNGVQVTGSCEKRILGKYGLVASVTALNTTDRPQSGTVWVRWAMVGEEPLTFSSPPLELASGGKAGHHVNQDVEAEPWFRTGVCDYGWTPK